MAMDMTRLPHGRIARIAMGQVIGLLVMTKMMKIMRIRKAVRKREGRINNQYAGIVSNV